MYNEMSEHKVHKMIERIKSSDEPLDRLAKHVLEASSDLDDLIRTIQINDTSKEFITMKI